CPSAGPRSATPNTRPSRVNVSTAGIVPPALPGPCRPVRGRLAVMSDERPYEATIEELYAEWANDLDEPHIEALLDESLHPRGPDMLFHIAAEIGVDSQDLVLEAGCRDGRHVVELVRRFGCR